jgi:hypothetical protein
MTDLPCEKDILVGHGRHRHLYRFGAIGPAAGYDISVDGIGRTFRDRKAMAIGAAVFLKMRGKADFVKIFDRECALCCQSRLCSSQPHYPANRKLRPICRRHTTGGRLQARAFPAGRPEHSAARIENQERGHPD